MLKYLVLSIASLLVTHRSAHADSKQEIILSAIDLPSYVPLYQETCQIINSVSDKYSISLQFMPNRRQESAVAKGIVAGIAIKTTQDTDQQRSLLRVMPPLFFAHSLIALHVASADLKDMEDLNKLKIAILNGSAHSMNIVPESSRVIVNSHLSGLSMLANKRVDGMSILDIAYYSTLKSSPQLQPKIKLATLKVKVPYNIYVHEKHKSIIPSLEEAVRKATGNGQIQGIYDRMIDEVKTQPKSLKDGPKSLTP